MTVILNSGISNSTAVRNNGVPSLSSHSQLSASHQYRLLYKTNQKVHNRGIIGLMFFRQSVESFEDGRENVEDQLVLVSLSHDSCKIWHVLNSSDADIELMEMRKLGGWVCALQSWDYSSRERAIIAAGIDASLYLISLFDFDAPLLECHQNPLMSTCYVRMAPNGHHLLSLNYSGHIELRSCSEREVVRAVAVDKVKQVSSVAYGVKYIALGDVQGFINVLNAFTLYSLYTIEAHSTKIRCLEFMPDQRHLLSAADDKVIKLFSLTDIKGSVVRAFCGHKNSIRSITIEKSSAGERFASCSLDRTIILWNYSMGEKLHTFDCSSLMDYDVLRCLSFSPGGDLLVAGTDESSLFIFALPPPDHVYNDTEFEQSIEETMDMSNPSQQLQPSLGASQCELLAGGGEYIDYQEEYERRELEMQLGID